MNPAKKFSCGLLLLSAGCLTAPGDLGAVGGSTGSAESEADASTASSDGTGVGAETNDVGTTGEGPTTGEESGEEPTTGEPDDPPQCDVGAGLQRRLTSTQLEHAIADLFDVSVEVQLDDSDLPFESGTSLSEADTAALAEVAATVSEEFAVPVCGGDEDTCAQEFLDAYVPLVLRGQVSVEAFTPIYEDVGEYQAGIRAVVGALVLHPAFTDVTPTGSDDGGLVALDANSFATRLALLVWNSVPDASLLAAAEGLSEPGSVEAHVATMLADPRYGRAQADLYSSMTGVRFLPSQDRSTVYEAWSDSVAASLVEEQRRFVIDQVGDADASLGDLLTSNSTFVNTDVAALYGVDLQPPAPVGDGWVPAELDASRRGGLLTQLGMIAAASYDRPAEQYRVPVPRGVSVLRSFFCQQVPPPPPDIKPSPSGPIESRDDWEAFVGAPECAGCHTLFDPLGFAFGDYDGVGRWDPRGDATNATHSMLADEFADALELGALLATSDDVRECVAEQYYRFALRRSLGDMDQCAVDAYAAAFTESDGNLHSLVQAIATSDAFRFARP